jgi:hypothetical protein
MTKVAYNNCYGGFSLSHKAVEYMAERGSAWAREALACEWLGQDIRDHGYHLSPFPVLDENDKPVTPGTPAPTRHDPLLVSVIEALGRASSGKCADLQIETIRGDRYRIDEYDGNESVQTPSDIEWTVAE